MIQITGKLRDDARHYVGGLGQGLVSCMVDAGAGMLFELRLHTGDDAAGQARAEREARALRAGLNVEISADRFDYVADHGHARFVVRQTQRVVLGGRVWT